MYLFLTADLPRLPPERPTGGGGDALALLRQGLALHRQGELDAAATLYRRVLAAAPSTAQAAHLLGLLEHQRGNQVQAQQFIGQALALQPRNPDYLTDMGLVLNALGRRDQAQASIRAALAVRPGDVRALNLLGGMLVQQGQHEEAVAHYRQALLHEPNNASLHSNLGSALTALGEKQGAIAELRQAVALDPASVDAQSNLGYALNEVGQYDEAIAHCREALRLAPSAPGPRFNLGLALLGNGEHSEAAEAFRAVIAQQPKFVEAMRGLGDALVKLGRTDEGLAEYRRAIALRPNYAAGLSNLLFHQNYRADGRVEAAVAEARRFGDLITDPAEVVTNHRNSPDPERRLRVGLVSGDLCAHPVGRFLDGPLAEIDRGQIDLYAYATIDREDAMTARLRESIPNWRKVAHLSDAETAALVQGDGIDILLDMGGHSRGNRLRVFARKPAPVAVTWLGYFATTGLPAIDYVLASPWVIPEAEAAQWVETPWRLPDTYLCFHRPPYPVAVGPLPAAANGFITFGSANNINKLSDETVACWAAVLRAVPASRLLLRTAALGKAEIAERTAARFGEHGIAAGRLILQPAVTDYAEHLSRYHQVDIALDPFPYNGGTTTVEALWMGVPVLTRRGDRYVSHMGENIMHNMGMPEWIAADSDDYLSKAAAFGADIPAMESLRAGLRDRLSASPLMDAPAFARNLEAAFRQMWQRWCRERHKGAQASSRSAPAA